MRIIRSLLLSGLLLNVFFAFGQTGIVTDVRDGKIYRTIEINNTYWLIDNLEYITENSIPLNSEESDKYKVSGRFYDMSEFETACPDGWQIPEVSHWIAYFEYIAETQAPGLVLEITAIEEPVHYTIANYSERIDLFNEGNALNLRPTGRIEGDVLNIPTDYADYWTKDDNEEAEGRSHIHFMNPWTTIHSHKHHLKPKQKKKLRKFMIRCVNKGGTQ